MIPPAAEPLRSVMPQRSSARWSAGDRNEQLAQLLRPSRWSEPQRIRQHQSGLGHWRMRVWLCWVDHRWAPHLVVHIVWDGLVVVRREAKAADLVRYMRDGAECRILEGAYFMTSKAAFDNLADDYDRYRPRYPQELAAVAVGAKTHGVKVVDAGAGTGICLEWLLPVLQEPQVHAIDISAGMVAAGRQKFPQVTWHVGRIEDTLSTLTEVDLLVAGQAYQWFDREVFLPAAAAALSPTVRFVLVQNNRDHARSELLSAYEGLLETHSPGYTRGYRQIDIAHELQHGLNLTEQDVTVTTVDWVREMPVDDFVHMAASSTQVQRAIEAVGEGFLTQVRELIESYAADGAVDIAYQTELFVAQRATRGSAV